MSRVQDIEPHSWHDFFRPPGPWALQSCITKPKPCLEDIFAIPLTFPASSACPKFSRVSEKTSYLCACNLGVILLKGTSDELVGSLSQLMSLSCLSAYDVNATALSEILMAFYIFSEKDNCSTPNTDLVETRGKCTKVCLNLPSALILDCVRVCNRNLRLR